MEPLQDTYSPQTAWKYLDAAQVIILVLRKDETVEFINTKGCELLGHSKEFIIGKNWFEFFISPKTQATDKLHYARALDKGQLRETYENSIWTREGHERTICWHGSFVRDDAGDIVAFLATGEDVTEKLALKKYVHRQQQQHKREVLSAIVETQEQERKDISGELHGNVNQILTTCKLLLESEKTRQPNSDLITNVYEYLQNAITEIRRLSHQLDPGEVKDLGLAASIKGLLGTIALSGKFELHFTITGEDHLDALRDRVALSIYRIAQEQLSNIIKHAQSSEIRFIIEADGSVVRMEIADNGIGFNAKTARRGLGLRNIYSRVALHQGTISVETSHGNGCILKIEIPS